MSGGGGPTATAGRGPDAHRALDPAWDRAWRSSPERTIFQSADWYRSWLATVGRHVEPIVLRTRNRRGALVGLALQRDPSASSVAPLSSPWADYHDAVGALDDLAGAALTDALHHLSESVARVELTEVRPGSALARIATRAGLRRAAGATTHAIDLTNPATVARTLDRAEHRKKLRRLRRIGDVQLTHHTRNPVKQERLGRFVAMHRAQWTGRPEAVAPFDGGAVDGFFRELTARCDATVISELTVAGEPVAMRFGFLLDHTYSGYRPCFDQATGDLSPGQLLLRNLVEDLTRRGLHRLDLLRGDHTYKARFADLATTLLTFTTDPPAGHG